jgi:2-desacetyl-2-hydroxyethyl bacteriochlorophyllide A dehydrogenase
MKTFLLKSKNNAKIAEAPEPKLANQDQVLVGVRSISICGTDSHIYSGDIPTRKMPIVMGHEAGGVILESGSNVTSIRKGEKVLIDPNIVDHACDLCKRGLFNLCRNGGILGRDADGVFAERIALPQESMYKVPSEIPDEVVPLIQPLSTVARGISFLSINPADTVLVIGLGAVGLMFSQLCKLKGATVLGARRTWLDHMLPLSKDFGVDHPINVSKTILAEEVRRLTDSKGVDSIILTSNTPEMIQECLNMVRPGGEILQFFNFHGTGSYDTYQLYMKEIKIIASRSSIPVDFKNAINLVSSRKIPLQKLITGRFSFDEAEKALEINEDRKSSLKVVIRF